ncbi:MAG: glycosyltransferase [Acidobacteriota bacterium]
MPATPTEPVTVIVVPRERFSVARRALETLYRETEVPFRLIYVDAGSPPDLAAHLERESRRLGFDLVRREAFLSPNEARNLGLSRATGRYVVFADNDLLVSRGWLSALVSCAEETGADLVGPLYGIGEPEKGRVHMAGGTARIEEKNGSRTLREEHRFAGRLLREVETGLRREETELVEFHCMLARLETLRTLGPLDEEILSTGEHVDLCLAVRKQGGGVWIEPAARVTYIPPPPLLPMDRAYFRLRWSERWTRRSFDRFRVKWQLSPGDPYFPEHLRWLRSHRRLPLQRVRQIADALPGRRLPRLAWLAVSGAEMLWNRWTVGGAGRGRQGATGP